MNNGRRREITLNDPALAGLLRVYGLGSASRISFIVEGRVNDNYDLVTETGRYVLRCSRGKRALEAITLEHRLMEYLAASGFPTPPLVRSRKGTNYHLLDGWIYRVTRFVEGSKYDPGNPKHLEEVAYTLARYHQLVRPYERPEQKEGFRPILVTLKDGLQRLPWGGDLRVARSATPPAVVDHLGFLHAQLEQVIARLEENASQEALPRLMIHGSCRLGSFIFQGDRVAAMLDYDNGYVDVRTLDIGIALLSFAAIRPEKIHFDPALIDAFLSAYQAVEPLSTTELALVPWYMRARILKRELARYERYLSRPKASREKMLQRAVAKLAWLDANEVQLANVFGP